MAETAEIPGRRRAASTYVAMLRAGFAAACLADRCRERNLVVGDRGVRLRFAGPALVEPMSAALAHLESSAPVPAAVTVLLWDAESTGAPLPPVPWQSDELEEHGQSRGYRVRDWDREGVYTLHDQDYGAITLFDAGSRTGIYATLDASTVPTYERAAPLRTILHWALSEPGRHLVHAGAVGGEDGGVLIAGRSGSGKSTLTLASVDSGLGYLGDDYVLVDVGTTPATAYAVFGTAKLDPDGDGWKPALVPADLAPDATDSGKVVLDVHRRRPDALVPKAPLRAVVLPTIGRGSRAQVRRASPAEGLWAVAPSTVLQHFGRGVEGMGTVAALMRGLPVYALELGSDVASAVGVVERLTRGLEP